METAANNNDNGGGGGVRKSSHPLPWLNLMVTEPFYLFHFLTFFSYVAVRSSASQNLPPDFSRHLLHREAQAFLTFSVLAAIKMVKQETWEAFIADALLYAKGLLCAVALIVDKHLALCYLLGFLVIFILTQQPPYDGLGDASHLTPLQLESKLTEGNTSKFWLIWIPKWNLDTKVEFGAFQYLPSLQRGAFILFRKFHSFRLTIDSFPSNHLSKRKRAPGEIRPASVMISGFFLGLVEIF